MSRCLRLSITCLFSSLLSIAVLAQGKCELKGDGSCNTPGANCSEDSGPGKCTNVPNGSDSLSCKCVGRCATDKGTVCANPVPTKGLVRLDIDDKNFDLQAFRDGVQAMKNASKKNPADPLGWTYQAYIHGTDDASPLTAQDCCQHSSWFFLSWHRMEIYYFERILRAMSGNPNLTVPYWNFTDQIHANKRAVPEAFRTEMYVNKQGKKVPNPLWDSHRQKGINDGKPICKDVVKWEDAFKQKDFFVPPGKAGTDSFGGTQVSKLIHYINGEGTGSLENVPHNVVHGTIGDGSPESLSDPDGAGLDPIFWPFHVNLDRAWYWWQKAHPRTLPDNKSDWATQQFIFYDVEMVKGKPQAKEVCLTGKQVVDIANQLGYTYDSGAPFTETGKKPGTEDDDFSLQQKSNTTVRPASVVSTTLGSEIQLADESVTVAMQLSSDVQQQLRELLSNKISDGYITLTIENIRADKRPNGYYNIYLNLPDGSPLPDEGEYYAGNLNFFGIWAHHRHDGSSDMEVGRSFDITDVVRQLATDHRWSMDKINITFAVPQLDAKEDCLRPPKVPPDMNLRFGKLTLSVTTPELASP